jgi:hypothetical protein
MNHYKGRKHQYRVYFKNGTVIEIEDDSANLILNTKMAMCWSLEKFDYSSREFTTVALFNPEEVLAVVRDEISWDSLESQLKNQVLGRRVSPPDKIIIDRWLLTDFLNALIDEVNNPEPKLEQLKESLQGLIELPVFKNLGQPITPITK